MVSTKHHLRQGNRVWNTPCEYLLGSWTPGPVPLQVEPDLGRSTILRLFFTVKMSTSEEPVSLEMDITSEEKTSGGLSYAVKLSEPSADFPKEGVKPFSPAAPKTVDAARLRDKMDSATKRRESLEASKKEQWYEKLQKLEEATRRREEASQTFIESTKAALEVKLESFEENRTNHLMALRTKVQEHLARVDSQLNEQTSENEELEQAAENRQEQINAMVKKLKDHEEHTRKVRERQQSQLKDLKESIDTKLDAAEKNRLENQKQTMERLKVADEFSAQRSAKLTCRHQLWVGTCQLATKGYTLPPDSQPHMA
ncbi:unnamed protein product [Cyprideis torosa]|uniref:Uncharacterized protein n=1 Tax=Cyprideis torosa TaxID=163714 RepID=A0A7R8W6W3_9CRUS|nr:unnamed protein product [Cyprideis torosa]CAG0886885.1 unnamed protein product [Cyprideis torosa]